MDFGPTLRSDLADGETKRILLTKAEKIPIQKEFTFDARLLPWDPEKQQGNVGIPLRYVLDNTKKHGLGTFTIEAGKVRLFQKDGHGSQIFLGEDTIAERVFTGGKVKLTVGDSRDIVVTQRMTDRKKKNIRRNRKNRVVLYDLEETLSVRVENFKEKPCVLRLVETIEGEWQMVDAPEPYEKETNETIVFSLKLTPKEKKNFSFTYLKKHLRK